MSVAWGYPERIRGSMEDSSAATESISTPLMVAVMPGRITISSGSMATSEPGALTTSFSMSPSPVTVVPVSRLSSLTTAPRSMTTVEPTAASSTVSLATVPLAALT